MKTALVACILIERKGNLFLQKLHILPIKLDIANFEAAVKLLREIIGLSRLTYFLRLAPTSIMHRRYNGLEMSLGEERVLQ